MSITKTTCIIGSGIVFTVGFTLGNIFRKFYLNSRIICIKNFTNKSIVNESKTTIVELSDGKIEVDTEKLKSMFSLVETLIELNSTSVKFDATLKTFYQTEMACENSKTCIPTNCIEVLKLMQYGCSNDYDTYFSNTASKMMDALDEIGGDSYKYFNEKMDIMGYLKGEPSGYVHTKFSNINVDTSIFNNKYSIADRENLLKLFLYAEQINMMYVCKILNWSTRASILILYKLLFKKNMNHTLLSTTIDSINAKCIELGLSEYINNGIEIILLNNL